MNLFQKQQKTSGYKTIPDARAADEETTAVPFGTKTRTMTTDRRRSSKWLAFQFAGALLLLVAGGGTVWMLQTTDGGLTTTAVDPITTRGGAITAASLMMSNDDDSTCVKSAGTFDSQKDYCFTCGSKKEGTLGYCWNSQRPQCTPACDNMRDVSGIGDNQCGDACDGFLTGKNVPLTSKQFQKLQVGPSF